MSLLKKDSIFKVYLKKLKKSIHQANRIDIFIILVLLILIITPLIINFSSKIEAAAKQVNLYISANCEELFGREIMETLLLEFEEKNPDIRIRLAYDSFSGEPDILFFSEGDFNTLIAAGMLAELNPFINELFKEQADLTEAANSQQLAIPLVSFMNMLFYNIDILTAAGFDHPPKTRNEFTTYARAVSRGNFNASGAAMSLSHEDNEALSRDIFSWVWAAGGNFWQSADRPSLTRAMTNDITFLGSLNRDGLLAPDIFETTGDQRIEQFARGETAMMIASTQVIPYLRERMGDETFGVTTIPDAGTGGAYSIGLSAIYAAISANSAHSDKAWSFLVFLAEKSPFLCEDIKAVPGIVSNIIPGDYVRNDSFYSKAWDIFESALIAESFSEKPGALEYEMIFLEELQIFFESSRSAQETVNAIQRRWDEVGVY